MAVPFAPMLQVSQSTSQTPRGEGDCRSIKRSWARRSGLALKIALCFCNPLHKAILGAAIGRSAVAIFGVTAVATMGNAGFHPGPQTRGTLSQDVHLNADRIKFQTKDATDVVVQEIKQDVGGDSGWHSHPGFVVGIVKSGSVSITVGRAPTTYSAGQTFLETGNTPVIARNAC